MADQDFSYNKMVETLIVDANSLYEDSFRLAKNIVNSGYRPDLIIAIWRSGASISIVVQEFFKYKKIDVMHTAIKANSYEGMKHTGNIRVYGLKEIINTASRRNHRKILLVDDVWETGMTLQTIRHMIPDNFDVKIAVLFFKPNKNKANIQPDFLLHETEKWPIFPHELVGLDEKDIKKKSKKIYEIVKE